MIKCPKNCRSYYGKEDSFCYVCGEKLIISPDPKCDCGEELQPYDRFCPKCGKEVNYAKHL